MPNRTPRTYDEIVRKTVPEPDSSWRPSPEQVQEAYEGHRALDADEEALLARVRTALTAGGIDPDRLAIEVERDKVTLRGEVPDTRQLNRAPEIVRSVPGLGELVDQLVVASRPA